MMKYRPERKPTARLFPPVDNFAVFSVLEEYIGAARLIIKLLARCQLTEFVLPSYPKVAGRRISGTPYSAASSVCSSSTSTPSYKDGEPYKLAILAFSWSRETFHMSVTWLGVQCTISFWRCEPPALLRSAVSDLRIRYESDSHQIQDTVNDIR
jgi:hypothetical protein